MNNKIVASKAVNKSSLINMKNNLKEEKDK